MDDTPRDDPVAVVRAWLEAPRERAREYLTGPLRAHYELETAVEPTYEMTKRPPEIRALSLREETAGYAVCELEALLTYDIRANGGRESVTSRTVSGPVVLGRTEEGWRIADFDYGGRRAVESVRAYDADSALAFPGLTIRPLGLGLFAAGTNLTFELTNTGPAELVLQSLSLPRSANLMKAVPWAYLDGRTRIGPGETARIHAEASAILPLDTPEITFSLYVRPAGGKLRLVRLTVPFADEAIPPRATAKTIRGLRPRQAWLINGVVVIGIVALLGIPGWVPFFGDSEPDPNSREGVVAAFIDAARDGDDAAVRQLAVRGGGAVLAEAAGEIRKAVELGFTHTEQDEEDGEVIVWFLRPSLDTDCWFGLAVRPREVDGTWRLAYAVTNTEDMCIE